MKKITITLTEYQAEAIERIRRQRGVPRSRVIQQALDLYLASQQAVEEAERTYGEGYRAIPEDLAEAEVYARASAAVLGREEWM